VIGDILQPTHLLFVLVIALLVLGPKRLPEVGRAIGSGLRDFRAAINGDDDHHEEITDAPGFESYRDDSLDEARASEMPEREPVVVAYEQTPTSDQEPAPPAHPEDSRGGSVAEAIAGSAANSSAGPAADPSPTPPPEPSLEPPSAATSDPATEPTKRLA
jgi:sec-independent protein translocase protein TatA